MKLWARCGFSLIVMCLGPGIPLQGSFHPIILKRESEISMGLVDPQILESHPSMLYFACIVCAWIHSSREVESPFVQ